MTIGDLQRRMAEQGYTDLRAFLRGGEWRVSAKSEHGGWVCGQAPTLADAIDRAIGLNVVAGVFG